MSFLSKKFGPLPAWAWGLIVIALIGLVIWYRKRQATAAAASSSTTASGSAATPSGGLAISCTNGVATCPAGYEDDGSGTCTCTLISGVGTDSVPGALGSAAASVPTTSAGTCPAGYQLDPTGTFCEIIETPTPTTSSTTGVVPPNAPVGSIAMPASGCPSGYTADPTGTYCYVAPAATTPPSTATPPPATTTPPAATAPPASTATTPPATTAPATSSSGTTAATGLTADQYAAQNGLVQIDMAEAKLAIAKGISYYTWQGGATSTTGGHMVGSRSAQIPSGTLYGFSANLDSAGIPHAGP